MVAWDLVMRALSHYWRLTREDSLVAQALLEQAISIDPNYGQAHSVLATSHFFSAHMGWEDWAKAAPIAERSAHAAILADNEDPWAHFALGCVYYMFEQRFEDSRAEFEIALRLNPNFSRAQVYCCLLFTQISLGAEAELALQRALKSSPRDPLSALYFWTLAYAEFAKGNYKEAIRLARESVRQRPDFSACQRVLAAAAGMAGEDQIAKAAVQELCRAQPNGSLEWIKQLPFEHSAEREHFLEGLRRAGLD
jgi:tetratricopeptide (TPR) repeat protein